MVIDYSQAKIYKIVCNTIRLTYVGSTCKPRLCQRLNQHVQDFKAFKNGKRHYLTSYEVLKNNNYSIVFFERVLQCTNKDELKQFERKFIEQIDCVDKVIPCRTQKEYKENNKDKIREYYQDNKDKIKQYYQDTLSIKYKCDCGSVLSKGKKLRHEKSIKHQKFINQNN